MVGQIRVRFAGALQDSSCVRNPVSTLKIATVDANGQWPVLGKCCSKGIFILISTVAFGARRDGILHATDGDDRVPTTLAVARATTFARCVRVICFRAPM